jgi:hypothetical protein
MDITTPPQLALDSQFATKKRTRSENVDVEEDNPRKRGRIEHQGKGHARDEETNETGGREGKVSEDSEGDEEMGDDGASDSGSEESEASEYDLSILEKSLEPNKLVQLLSILIKWAYHRVDYADQVIYEKLKAILYGLVLLKLYLPSHFKPGGLRYKSLTELHHILLLQRNQITVGEPIEEGSDNMSYYMSWANSVKKDAWRSFVSEWYYALLDQVTFKVTTGRVFSYV